MSSNVPDELYEHYEALPMNWSFLLRATTKWRKSQRSCWLMLLGCIISCVVSYFSSQVLLLAVGFFSLAIYDYSSAKRSKTDIELGKTHFLKNIRALSGAVEHRKLSDEIKQTLIARLSDYERKFLELSP